MRPEPEHRFIYDRTAPAVISMRTEWNYVEGGTQEDEYHAVTRGAKVTDYGEFPVINEWDSSACSTVNRMIESFGDDADLEIIVRRKKTQPERSSTFSFDLDIKLNGNDLLKVEHEWQRPQ